MLVPCICGKRPLRRAYHLYRGVPPCVGRGVDLETSTMRRCWSDLSCSATGKNQSASLRYVLTFSFHRTIINQEKRNLLSIHLGIRRPKRDNCLIVRHCQLLRGNTAQVVYAALAAIVLTGEYQSTRRKIHPGVTCLS